MGIRKRILPRGWYPASAHDCSQEIGEFLAGFTPPTGTWVGGVAPHAGWAFSGRAAARVISTLAGAGTPDRVVIYGGHLPGDRHPVIYTDDGWETPLGVLDLDAQTAKDLVEQGRAVRAGAGFNDNTVEVMLPFVKHFFPRVPVLAVHAPSSAKAIDLGSALDEVLGQKRLSAIFVGSADLTHYGPNYGFVPKGTGPAAVQWVKDENDKALIDKALAMDAQGVLEDARNRHNSCSPGPIAAVIASVDRHGVENGRLLEYYTSYDVIPGSSFVGYAAIVY
ncbi:MAG: AmmeMemoRadiSam system protein B [Thermodesulfobacteriota bacterium]